MNVVMVFRSKVLNYFSIEKVFKNIKHGLTGEVNVESLYVEKPGFRLNNLSFLRKEVRSRNRNTIYHVTGDIHYCVFAFPRHNCILTIHDCVFLGKSKGFKRWILKKLFLDWPVWYVPVVTAVSEKTRFEVISLTGCNPEKVRVINNPVASQIVFINKSFNTSKPVLLFIGSTPNKNLCRVIEAIKGFPCILNIVGDTGNNLLSKMKDYNIEYRQEKNLSDEEMIKRYQMADVILFPSLYEGFGLPVIEGFKAGRPVLTSEISPLKELAAGAAWLVDPYNPESIRSTLNNIICDKDSRERKVQSGKVIAEKFASEIIASRYHSVYKEVFEKIKSK